MFLCIRNSLIRTTGEILTFFKKGPVNFPDIRNAEILTIKFKKHPQAGIGFWMKIEVLNYSPYLGRNYYVDKMRAL